MLLSFRACATDFAHAAFTPNTMLSKLQVFDTLTAAGIGQHNSVLASLFCACKVHESLMPTSLVPYI